MSTNHEQRTGFKWTVNECLRLEREYDLLKLSVEEIALLHQRSPYAIMYKLDEEGIAEFNQLYQQTYPNKESSAVEESEAEESEASVEETETEAESEADEDYDRYDMRKQITSLTKQLSNLTAVVYKYVVGPSSVKHRSAF
jgi:hypothetical protein